jgi:hypothetical protein
MVRSRANPRRLSPTQIARLLADCPDELCDLVLELRDLVCRAAPGSTEAIKFGCLCYFKPDQPYGAIGGNVCMIGWREDCVHLAFIHGASLPDPDGLLKGHGKAKRFVEIRSSADIHQAAVGRLVEAALAYRPGSS